MKKILAKIGAIIEGVLAVAGWIMLVYFVILGIKQVGKILDKIQEKEELNPERWELAEKAYKEGKKLFWAKDFDKAIEKFTEAIELFPYHRFYYWRGKAYYYKGKLNKAIGNITKAIELNPSSFYYSERSKIFFQKRKYKKAIDDLTKAIYLSPDDGELFCMRGKIFWVERDFDKVIEELTKAISIQKKKGLKVDSFWEDCYSMIVDAYLRKGGFNKAFKVLIDAIRFSDGPFKSSFYEKLLGIALMKGNYDEVIEYFTKVILQSNSADGYYFRGRVYYEKGDYDRAIADFSKAIEIQRDNSEFYNWRGMAFFKKGLYKKAISDFTKAIMLEPTAEYYQNRGQVYQELGLYDKADKDFREAKKREKEAEIEITKKLKELTEIKEEEWEIMAELDRLIESQEQLLRQMMRKFERMGTIYWFLEK